MKVAVIIPAYNESKRIGRVLETVIATPGVHRVIVVDDGSLDGTADVAAQFAEAHVERLKKNVGKGGAMLRGAEIASDSDVLLFFDADLINLTPAHVASLFAPVASGEYDMALGRFAGGRGATDLAQLLVPFITGQRAIRRSLFNSIPDLDRVGFGIEMAITLHVRAAQRPVTTVTIPGVTHPMKEEKLGFWRGFAARLRMYAEMMKFTVGYVISGKAREAKKLSGDREIAPLSTRLPRPNTTEIMPSQTETPEYASPGKAGN